MVVELRSRYPNDPRSLPEMRAFVRNGCLQLWQQDADNRVISELELAVSEAGSNIILHGFNGQPDDQIELILTVEIDRACVTFLYPGCEFTPGKVPAPDFTGCSESGFGLYLMQQSVSEVDFSRDEVGYCRIRFVKNRS